jgi:hypothetical protein
LTAQRGDASLTHEKERTMKYTSIVTASVPNPKACELTESHVAIRRLARQLDDLRARIESDSREMARRFESYADSLSDVSYIGTPPTSYSTLTDIVENVAKFRALEDAFKECFEPLTGCTLRDAMSAAVQS